MEEMFKNAVLAGLCNYDNETLKDIEYIIDKASQSFEIKQKDTAIALTVTDGLPEIAKYYIVSKRVEGLAESTLKNYMLQLKLFFGTVRKDVGAITTTDIRLYLHEFHNRRGVTMRTLNKVRDCLNAFFIWVVSEGYITANPVINVKPIKHEVKPRQYLTQFELEYLRLACETIRDKAMIEVMYSTGCRVSELANLKKPDVNFETEEVHLFGKGNKHRVSFLNAKAKVMLLEYFESRKDHDEHVFVSERTPHEGISRAAIEKRMRELVGKVPELNGKHVTPHTMRHTCATSALSNGMPISDISTLLGHASVATTMIYAKTTVDGVHNGHRRTVV